MTTGLLIAGASLTCGGLLGFLFGIPRTLNNEGTLSKDDLSGYRNNDNLVQISDWLTKIIVGVGLTQLYAIPGFLNKTGKFLSPALGSGDVGKITSVTILLYFLACGFLISYVWTRLHFKKILVAADKAIEDMVKMMGKKVEDVEKRTEKIGDYFTTGVQPKDYKSRPTPIPNLKVLKPGTKSAPADDPQKFQWGEKAEINGRRLRAKVTQSEFSKEYFNVLLEVISTDSNKPLTGFVIFHLHPTFPNPDPKVDVVKGVAQLNLLAWGGFTVGAEADNGETLLELDLSQEPEAPELFKSR